MRKCHEGMYFVHAIHGTTTKLISAELLDNACTMIRVDPYTLEEHGEEFVVPLRYQPYWDRFTEAFDPKDFGP